MYDVADPVSYQMQEDLADYTQFYKRKHQGRKLDWDHALGTATLRARFDAGEKELSVSLYQAVILLLFNEESTMSYADIKEQTRLGDLTRIFAFAVITSDEQPDR